MEKIQTLIVDGLAISTRRSYEYWWFTFLRFCARFQIDSSIPVPEITLCGFAAFTAETACHATVKVALAAIKSKHTDLGFFVDSERMVLLNRVLRGISLKPRISVVKPRLPVTTELLARFREILDLSSPDDILFWAVCCTGTYGLLRSGEIFGSSLEKKPGLRRSDVLLVSNHEVQLVVRQSKTDRKKQGATITLYSNGTASCPVEAFTRYWNRLGRLLNQHSPLFCLDHGTSLDKDLFVQMLRLVVAKLGLNPSDYSGHSFRRGGATSLAAAGVPAAMIKQMGRWKSLAYQVYIDNTQEEWRRASQAMGQAQSSKVKVVFGVDRKLFH
jgi:hypothetical protein